MLVERNVCREHADDSVQATVRPYEVNTEDIVATEKAPGERGVQSNGNVMMALDSAGDTFPTSDTEQIMTREHDRTFLSTWCGIGRSPTADCIGTISISLCTSAKSVSTVISSTVLADETAMIRKDLEDSPVAMAAPAATSGKVASVKHRYAPCSIGPRDKAEVNTLLTGAHAERQVCAEHAERTVQDANHLNDENKEATIEAPAPGVCGTRPQRVLPMGDNWTGASTMTIDDAKTLRIGIDTAIDRMWCNIGRSPTTECTATAQGMLCLTATSSICMVPSPVCDSSDQQTTGTGRNEIRSIGNCSMPMTVAAGMTSNDGGVGTFRENHRTGNECHSDIERIREYGRREIKTLLKPGAIVELFPGTPDVVNTDQVTMNGGVRQVWYIRDHTKSGQHRASKRGRADDRMRRVDEDQGVRPPDVAIDERIAHVEACDMSGNRVQQCATAVVTANGDKPSGKFHHSGMNEMRSSILATLATNMMKYGHCVLAIYPAGCFGNIA
jgi:hypothetical protein